MFRKAINKIKRKETISIERKTGEGLKAKCTEILKHNEFFANSPFYCTYLSEVMLEPMSTLFNQKVNQLEQSFEKNLTYEIQLASISLSLSEEDGLLQTFVCLWVSFCEFELKKIVNSQLDTEAKSDKLKTYFHQQLFLFTYFIYNICLYLYERPFYFYKQFEGHLLFVYVRDHLTAAPTWKQIHNIIRYQVLPPTNQFTDNDVLDNMKDLEKLIKLSEIPIPFMDTRLALKEFWQRPEVDTKISKAIQLMKTVKREISEYREHHKMASNYPICTDDMFSALTYCMWGVGKNIYGACSYIEVVLCCEYDQINSENLAHELQSYHEEARHAIETLLSISRIGLLTPEQKNLI